MGTPATAVNANTAMQTIATTLTRGAIVDILRLFACPPQQAHPTTSPS